MTRVELNKWGPELFGRSVGESVRISIADELSGVDHLVIDATGVEAMSLSFADEAFAVLASDLNRQAEGRPHIAFDGVSPEVGAVIRLALARARELA
ncbi:MAG: DUF4325 domain-containing protein [Dehalococcoidia bacterium]